MTKIHVFLMITIIIIIIIIIIFRPPPLPSPPAPSPPRQASLCGPVLSRQAASRTSLSYRAHIWT